MIIEKYQDPTTEGYAILLIADYHLEYPLAVPRLKSGLGYGRVQLLWDSFNIQEASGASEVLMSMVQRKFWRRLEAEYNGYYENGMNLWRVQGNIAYIHEVFMQHRTAVMQPPSGDDDTYDYWPNALEMLMVLARDLIELTEDHKLYSGLVADVVFAIDEHEGEDWSSFEAEDYRKELLAIGVE